jgi:hypothetical protein
MSREPLPPDPDSVEKWERLPQNKPSRQALPPMTSGGRMWGMLILFAFILLVLSLLLSRGA